jgi:hypothetical protein
VRLLGCVKFNTNRRRNFRALQSKRRALLLCKAQKSSRGEPDRETFISERAIRLKNCQNKISHNDQAIQANLQILFSNSSSVLQSLV